MSIHKKIICEIYGKKTVKNYPLRYRALPFNK
jgi:hypothetical protein